MNKLIAGFLGISVAFLVSKSLPSIAGDKPPEDADKRGGECEADARTYAHGALGFYHRQLCMLNVQFPGQAEEFLFKLVTKLGLNPDLTLLAADGTATALESKTHDGKTVTGTVQKVVAPSTFSTVYDYKAEVKVDGATFTTMYWTGAGATSKGFLIMGGVGFAGKKKLLYVKWDRSTVTQTVDILGARIDSASTYLADPTKDDAIQGSVSYNTTTKETSLESVHLTRQRGASPSSSVFACWKMYAVGTSGGAMRVGKTQDSLSTSGTGHLRTLTSQDGIAEMDDWEGNDTKTEPNGTGNGTAVQGFAMKYSCADLNGASAATKPFEGNTVNFAMTKTQMDTMFGTN